MIAQRAAGPAGGPAVLLAVGMWLLIAVVALITPADPDLWGHLRFGDDILATGQIVQADRYSFTSDRPWINHEWLSETTFAAIYSLAGSGGLVAFKTVTTAALMGLIWWHLRRHRAGQRVATLLLLIAFIGTHWRLSTIRPQLFSVVLFALLLMLIADAEEKPRWRLWLVVPMMTLWANLHGGWIVGLGALWVWIGSGIVAGIVTRRPCLRDGVALLAVGVGATLATAVNPYGVKLWEFLWQTVGLQRPDIQEWKPITSSLAVGVPWVLVLATGGAAYWRGGGARSLRKVAIVVTLAVASIAVSRLDAFFALSVIIMLTPELLRAFPQGESSSSFLQRHAVANSRAVQAITLVAVATVVGYGATILWPAARCIAMESDWVPERGAGRFIAANHLRGRLLTWFDWGEYVIWHFGPQLQVSYDGRRETVYSDRVIKAHGKFYEADASASGFLENMNPDYIWIPNTLPVNRQLQATGWTAIFRGSTSSIYSRAPERAWQAETPAPPVLTGARCFPDS